MSFYLDKTKFESKLKSVNSLRDRLILLLFYETGLKSSELVNIKISNFSKNTLKLNNRIIELSSQISQEIKKYLSHYSPSNYLFFSRQSPQISVRRIEQIIKSYDIPSPSNLRKSSIINALQKEPVKKVKQKYSLKSLREKNLLSNLEFGKLVSHATSLRDEILMRLFYETGFTASQVSNLKLSDINKNIIFADNDLRFSNERKSVKISPLLLKKISEYKLKISPSNYLFFSRQSSQMSVRRIEQIISSYSKLFSRKISPQVLANSYKANIVAKAVLEDSFSLHHEVSQKELKKDLAKMPRLYEGYYQNLRGGDNGIT